MRLPRAIGLTAAVLTAVLGLPVPATAAGGGPSDATVHVDRDSAACSDTGAGSTAQPYCSIGAAAAAAQPGWTVQIAKGSYTEDLRITRSGTEQAPITFTGDHVELRAKSPTPARQLTVIGVHDVVFRGLSLGETLVQDSQRITLDRNYAFAVPFGLTPLIEVGGASRDVAVTRNFLQGAQYGSLRVSGGATGTTISDNAVLRAAGAPVSVDGAPGTTVTNNTLALGCGPGIALTGGSTGANLYNNVVDSHAATGLDGMTGLNGRPCLVSGAATEILVSADSVPGTTADYNLLRAAAGGTPYNWAGQSYPTPEAFRAATGQGRNDLMADPKLSNPWSPRPDDCQVIDGKLVQGSCSPAIDSAKPDAPGVLPTDINGHAPADDPYVANPGPGHLDRGAYEVQDELSDSAWLTADQPQAPYGTKVTFTARAGHSWNTEPLSYAYDFGDGTTQTTSAATVSHTYARACACQPGLKVTSPDGQVAYGGSDPVKATVPGPLTAQFSATTVLPVKTDWSADPPFTVLADATATATASAWPVTNYHYDFGDGYRTDLSFPSQKHTYQAPGDYKVSMTVTDNQGRVSTASQVYHAAYEPGGYTAVTPFRALDTRTYRNPLWADSSRTVDLSSWGQPVNYQLSAGMTAVVLNVTATEATQDTFLTVWPTGQPRPASSNLNVKAGQTVANLVTVPVGHGQSVDVYNRAGQAGVIVDVVGYYQPGAGNKFTPSGPTRLLDTRPSGGQPDVKLTQGESRAVQVVGQAGVPASARAVVLNLTATGATKGGYLTAYPHGANRPGVSSLNFTAGQTVANQAIVPIGDDGKIDLYNFLGDTQVVADVFGYYGYEGTGQYTPIAPTRLLDTRATGPVGTAGRLSVQVGGAHGVPAGATAAVLNVTATQPTADGFLTVWPDGGARPTTSNLNFQAGRTVPNHVITPLGANGGVAFYNRAGDTHVIADLFGYFTNG
ncbi:hypothetical protein GCM10009760_22980 [Kitasatospora kazusensis]|uniref:PKD domain-containing protein n=1 Tax=Kitasatospora kazusensis TaxID=407974 RepID=A0ABN2ZCJ2_9ACTN